MKPEDIVKASGLEEKHYRVETIEAPVIDSHLYTTLGRRLFEFYQKYKIEVPDQREMESLTHLLSTFNLHRSAIVGANQKNSRSLLAKLKSIFSKPKE